MQSVREKIISEIKKAVKELTGLDVEVSVDRPRDEGHGDYSSNIALTLFANSKLKTQNSKLGTPLELANKIASSCQRLACSYVEKVEAVKPGFINFHLSERYLLENVELVLEEKDRFGASEKDKNKKIMVEFAHPNTHKEFHIGHLRNITLGESICRILTANSADIKRVNYQGDIGLHVAKAIFGVTKLIVNIDEAEKWSLTEKAKFLGKAYAFGSKSYEESSQKKEEIIKINKQIYLKDPKVVSLWEKTRQWSLDYFDAIYKRVDSKFERLYFESEVFESGKNIVLSHVNDRIFEKSDGAIIFDGEKYGLHKRVFVTKEGNPTYEGKEMGLGPLEYKEFKFDQALHIVGPEQAGYFKVVFKALEKIDSVFIDKQKHLAYGFVQLKEGKMSSRTGNVVSGEWLLDEAKNRIKKSFKEMDEETAEKVATGAVKYSMLKFSRESNIQFSFEDSISLEGNSGPYLQYTFARTQSVVRKSEIRNPRFDREARRAKSEISFARGRLAKLETEEVSLLRTLQRFPEIVEEAAENFAPNLLCNYLFDLSQKFNLFYQKHKILQSRTESQKEFRLGLTMAVGQIIKNGLYLLGIQAPQRM